jgi:hypothetical protein
MPAVTHFLNVDLEVHSPEDLTPLAAGMASATHLLQCERVHDEWVLAVETAGTPASAQDAITGLLDAVLALPDEAARLWRGARRRCFDVGVESAHGPTWKTELSAATLHRIADQAAVLALTIYSPPAS